MALTTLIGLLAISASVKIEPAKVTIETKVFNVVESAFVLEGGGKVVKPTSQTEDKVHVLTFTQFDEAKLLKNKGIKLISSPIIRTLNDMKAEIKIENKATEGIETWSTSYVPNEKDASSLNLDVNLATTKEKNPSQSWSFETKLNLKSGQPHLLMVVRGEEKRLYLIKAHIED